MTAMVLKEQFLYRITDINLLSLETKQYNKNNSLRLERQPWKKHAAYQTQNADPDQYHILSHDLASESDITPCNKIDKPLVDYSFLGNVMTSITTLLT